MVDAADFWRSFREGGISDVVAARGAAFVDAQSRDWSAAGLRTNVGMLCPAIDIDDSDTVRLLFPPRMEKLAVSQDFYAVDFTAALPAGVGSSVEVCSFQLIDGMVGFLQQMSIYVLTPTAATRVKWEVRIGNAPVSGFSEIQVPPMAAAGLYVPRNELQLRIGNSQRVSLVAHNLGAGAETVGGELAGWFHPQTAEAVAWNLPL